MGGPKSPWDGGDPKGLTGRFLAPFAPVAALLALYARAGLTRINPT